jgi:hypothetical protein
MKNNKNNKNQAETSAISEVLNLDLKTREILYTISDQLNKTPQEIIKEMAYAMERLFRWNNRYQNNRTKEDLAFTFDSMIQHLHILPQIAESISILSGRDSDVTIGNLDICLERNAVTFNLGLGIYDLEKVFVTMEDRHIQLFSNRYLSDKYTADEIEKIKEYAHTKVKESVPYADVAIGAVERNNMNKSDDLGNTGSKDQLAANTIVRIKEVELTIKSHNIKYLPIFHKFNGLMGDVIYYFGNRIKN